ncbi:MAG: glycosyltransferase, partial [Solirubrobacterales bacterium]
MRRPAFAGPTRDPDAVAADLEALRSRPLITVVMPTYETKPPHLREAIWSVTAQEYPDWELVIVDDGSTDRSTRRELGRWDAREERIVVSRLDRNSGISAATNRAIEHSSGELVAFLDHDDALSADALMRMAHAFGDRDIDVAYSDQDKITTSGKRRDPFLKPDWSPVYALGAMYVGHLLVARRDLILESGGMAPEFDGIQDFELLLRMSERTDRIHHIDRVLYHWRAVPGSVALDPSEKPGIDELQARAVNEHLRRREIRARAAPHGEIEHRLRLDPAPLDPPPLVSVVIPARGEEAWPLTPLLERTSHARLEVIVVQPEWVGGDGGTNESAVRVDDPGETFNPGRAANLGAARSSGEWLLFLGEDVEVTERNWVQRLLAHAGLPGVGAVAPTLTQPDGRVDEAGLAIGLYDPVVAAMRGFPADSDGYYGSLSCAREVSALGMVCLLIRRTDFDRVGGFEEAYSRQHQAHDLCMRLAKLGLS